MKAKLTLAYYASLQEIRNSRFFYILAISTLFTLSFIPPQDAAFSTISFAGWQPLFNSEWIGITTAIMSTIVLSVLGFYLIIDNISKEKQYRTQEVIMVSPVSNFRYLLYRTLSGSFLLISILIFSMMVSILLSIYYNGFNGTTFLDIIIPYILISIPCAAVIATTSTMLEVFLPKKRMLRYVIFLVLFSTYVGYAMLFQNANSGLQDPLGIQYSLHQLMTNVKHITQDQLQGFSIGFSINNPDEIRTVFEYTGTEFSSYFIWSRAFIIVACIFLIGLVSLFFNRLSFFQNKIEKTKDKLITTIKNKQTIFNLESLTMFPKSTNVNWRDNVLAEIYLFQKWTSPVILMLTVGLLLASFFVNIQVAHRFVLPIIILLQIPVLSDMLTRDKRLRTEVFFKTSVISSTYRMLFKGLSVLLILSILSSPFIIRYIIGANILPAISILIGLVLITTISFLFGMIFQSKKPFELIMILITYACINKMEGVDYLGIYNPSLAYIMSLSMACIAVVLIGLFYNYKILNND